MNIATLSFIHIDDIRLHAHHGVLPQEQATGNDYTINIRIGYDISRAMQTDDVTDTLNYAEVFNVIKQEMAMPSKLIEHVCGRIANRLMEQYADVFPEYDFASNKGYGSAAHIAALKEYGPTPIHRHSFIKNFGF